VISIDATDWFIVSVVGYSLAGLLFIIAIIMFFKLKIPAVIGDLSGRTAAKQIQELRKRNSSTGIKLYKPDVFNIERGKLTEPVKNSDKLTRETMVNQPEDPSLATVVLNDETTPYQETMLLTEETELLFDDRTEVLDEDVTVAADETTVLDQTEELPYQEPTVKQVKDFKMIKDMKVTHTDETI